MRTEVRDAATFEESRFAAAATAAMAATSY